MTERDPAPASTVGATREDLEREILHEHPRLTSGDVVDDDESRRETARVLWRALGFPGAGDSAAFTSADKDAMAKLLSLVDSGAVDFDVAVKLTRAVGRTLSRLADWQVTTLTEYVERLEAEGRGTGSRLTTALEVIRGVEPPFEELMTYVWRRHLAAAVARVEALGATDSDLHTVTVTVGFADLVSFTRLSTEIAQDRLAEMVEGFESRCADLVAARGGRVIKTLGDSVLFIADGPRAGVDIAVDIVERIGGDRGLPDVHVGIATGPVVMRLGDVFGSPVNMASRMTGVARRNRVICDATTADAVREIEGYVLRPLTERQMRGFGVVSPIAVRRL
ncbi:MAG: adenylate/guanylate cyclase domain-containing protein [Propionibacteriales bacterium]|nr:adenylate/guanylate cyclase domain-containing protein [Propionibacteriales bacterium]